MIHQIRIRNFRSLRDVTVDLAPVTVFVGKSGTGKTNFATAIRFLRDYLVRGAQVAQQYPVTKCATNPSGATEFQVVFDVPGFADRFVYTLNLSEQHLNYPPRMESLEYGDRTIFRQASEQPGRQPKWEVQPSLMSPPQAGPAALGRLPALEEAIIAFTALTTGIGVYAFAHNIWAAKESGGGDRATGLADDGRNYLEVLREIASSLQNTAVRKGIAAALRRINATVVSVDLDSVQNPQTAVVAHRFGDKILPLELYQESDGFRRFYAHLLALYQTPPKQTLIFEEPENGIYPGALSLLADEFKAAPDSGRGQVLLTTHSPAFLDHFSADQIRVVELVDLETQIGRLAEEQRQAIAEELLRTGELLTVDPARRKGE